MWDYEANSVNDDYLYDHEDIEDDDGADSEMEALIYSSVYYQDVTNDQSKNESTEPIAGPSKEKRKVEIDEDFSLEKLTQFVSIEEEIDLVSSSDSEVKILSPRKPSRKKVQKKVEICVKDSSDSDDIFCEDEIDDFPIDISINVHSTPASNGIRSVVNEKKRKMEDKSLKGKKVKYELDAVEKMRKFYDDDTSEDEVKGVKRFDGILKGNWKISDADRFGWTESKQRFYGAGFGSRNRVRCRNCQQLGHIERDCPDPKRIEHCHLCGGENHKGDECLYTICTRCANIGHHSSVCRVAWNEMKKRCKRCDRLGHSQADCPDLWRRYYLTTNNEKIVRGSKEQNSRVFCYNCAKEGHWGHRCPKSMMNPAVRPSTPFILSYRSADELTSDDITKREMLDASNEIWKNRIDWRGKTKRNRAPKRIKYVEEQTRRPKKREESNGVVNPSPKKKKKKSKRKSQKGSFCETNEVSEKSDKSKAMEFDGQRVSQIDFFKLSVQKLKAKMKKKEEKKIEAAKLKNPDLTMHQIKRKCRRRKKKKIKSD